MSDQDATIVRAIRLDMTLNNEDDVAAEVNRLVLAYDAITAQNAALVEGLQDIINIIGPTSCKCEGQQADVDSALDLARALLAQHLEPSNDHQ